MQLGPSLPHGDHPRGGADAHYYSLVNGSVSLWLCLQNRFATGGTVVSEDNTSSLASALFAQGVPQINNNLSLQDNL